MHHNSYVPIPSFFDDVSPAAYQLWKKGAPLRRAFENKLFENVLFKRSKRSNLLKSRYYVLFDDRLAYYKSSREYQEAGYCLLLNVKLEIFTKEDEKDGKSVFGLRLSHNGQYCELYTRSSEIHNKWIKFLSKHCVLSSYSSTYNDIKTIGKGSFARVYLSQRKSDNQEFAVKTFSKALLLSKEKARASLINEITIMRKFQNENIIALEEVYESEHHIHLVLEVLHGGELFERIIKKGYYSERDACTLMQKLLTALAYMHSKGIMHRDIKPENLILKDATNDWNIKIADFGLAAFTNANEFLFRRCGTPGYVAPEILDDCKYDQKVDVFSAGVILYILLTGRSPFPGLSYNDLLRKNRACEIQFNFKDFNARISESAIDLMKKMLNKDPRYRCTAHEALRHEWIMSGGDFLSPKSKNPVYLNSALENMKRFQQENRFDVGSIKPKDLDRPSLFNLEKSLHAPSPLITGKVTTISETRTSFGMPSPNRNIAGVTFKSPNARVTLKTPKILEKSDEHHDEHPNHSSDDLDAVSCENNTVKTEMRKYSNTLVFPGLAKYTSPGKTTLSSMNTASGTQTMMTATTSLASNLNLKPAPVPMQKALNIQGNLLKFTASASPGITSTIPTITKPVTQKAMNVQGNLLKLLTPEVTTTEKKQTSNLPITPRQQRKREPLMNFLKPFY